jgi:protein-tyrosine phosphatase
MNQITDTLTIAAIDDVSEQPTSDYDLVVSVCQDTVDDNVGCEYDHYALADDEVSAANWGGTTDYSEFEKAADTVAEAMQHSNVLVHCHSGQNRSAAVCAAAITDTQDVSAAEAIEMVREARAIMNTSDVMRTHIYRYADQW